MGKRSLRRRTPFVAAVAFLIGPERQRPTDDGTCGDGSEVAAVEAVADFPIHEEKLVAADDAAALPDGQIAADPVALVGHPELRTFANDEKSDGSPPSGFEVCSLEGGFVPAFSRDGDAKDYVQHRIASHAMRVWRMLRAGAAVYVAGSAAKMPQDVRETMEKVVEACGKVSIDDARAYVRGMENRGRYVVEAW